jgi:hypothetical protein
MPALVPLSDAAVAVITSVLDGDYLFPGEHGVGALPVHTVGCAIRRAQGRFGIAQWTAHDLTFSSNTTPMAIPSISRHNGPFSSCPLYPQKRTFVSALTMSALCHKRTLGSPPPSTVGGIGHGPEPSASPPQAREDRLDRGDGFLLIALLQVEHELEAFLLLADELALPHEVVIKAEHLVAANGLGESLHLDRLCKPSHRF